MKFPGEWTRWNALEKAVEGSMVEDVAGAYVIRVRKRAIQRVVGVDALGILTIGESSNLRGRLRAFYKCATNPGARGHMAGWRYSYLGFADQFPIHQLDVRWCKLHTKADAYGEEGRLLAEYVAAHLELPPLNYKFNWPN